jgi:hypothetical protein
VWYSTVECSMVLTPVLTLALVGCVSDAQVVNDVWSRSCDAVQRSVWLAPRGAVCCAGYLTEGYFPVLAAYSRVGRAPSTIDRRSGRKRTPLCSPGRRGAAASDDHTHAVQFAATSSQGAVGPTGTMGTAGLPSRRGHTDCACAAVPTAIPTTAAPTTAAPTMPPTTATPTVSGAHSPVPMR